eukprot:1668017-Rhodomonas_salina.1
MSGPDIAAWLRRELGHVTWDWDAVGSVDVVRVVVELALLSSTPPRVSTGAARSSTKPLNGTVSSFSTGVRSRDLFVARYPPHHSLKRHQASFGAYRLGARVNAVRFGFLGFGFGA